MGGVKRERWFVVHGAETRVLNIDLEDSAFWLSSIALIQEDLTRFETLLPSLKP